MERRTTAWPPLAAALLGFFVITLDALVVNVALPAIGDDLNAGMTGLQWVVDSYTLMFAALLLSAGALSDLIGARRAFGAGLAIFVAASVVCGLAPNLGILVAARLLQGAGAAIMLPASLALIRQAYLGAARRAWAIGIGALGGALEVEAPHVTRQVQRLQQAGYADRAPDPDDRRAHLIQLTPAGKAASDRIRQAGTSGMQAALAHWPPHELHQLATLLHRMVDDFLAYSAAEEPGQPAR